MIGDPHLVILSSCHLVRKQGATYESTDRSLQPGGPGRNRHGRHGGARRVMTRPPRDPQGRVITGRMWFDIIYVGVIMAIGTLLVMDWALPGGLLSGGG